MSAIQFLRERAGVLIAGIIGLSLLLFVVSDFFGGKNQNSRKMKKYYEIGEIDGEYISYQDYEKRIQNLVDIVKLSGRNNIDESTAESIREQVWQQLVREKILDRHFRELGIGVSNEELDELVLGDNPHPSVRQLATDPSTGLFNKSFLVNFLKQTDIDDNARKYWLFFENDIITDRANTKFTNYISKGLYTTGREAEFDASVNAPTVDFSFIVRNYASIPDSAVSISRKEIEEYYSKHKESFRKTALRDIEYVVFDVVPSADDARQVEQWITRTRDEFAVADRPDQFINLSSETRYTGMHLPINEVPGSLRDFVRKEDKVSVFGPYLEEGTYKIAKLIDAADRPDSVHARHILLGAGQSRSIERARSLADSLLGLVKKGVSFEKLAASFSDDKGSAQLGGDLGWFTEGKMIMQFNNACFSARKGDILKVETTYGMHVIEILDQSAKVRKYNTGIIDRKITPGSATNQQIYSQASMFAGTNVTYDKFNSAIASLKLGKRKASDVAPNQKTLPGLDNCRALVIALFSTPEGKIVTDNSDQAVFEIDDKYVVAYCTRVQEEGIAPVKDVESDIKFALYREKKAGLLSAEFRVVNQAGSTLEDIAGRLNLNIQDATRVNFRSFSVPGVGAEPALAAAATVARQGTVAGPVEGNNGVYMLEVNNVSDEGAGNDIKLTRDRLMASTRIRGGYEAYEALRDEAKVIDKRYKFY